MTTAQSTVAASWNTIGLELHVIAEGYKLAMWLIHSGHFYSASSSPLPLERCSQHSTDTVPEFHAEALQATVSEGLAHNAQGPYVAARTGVEPMTLRTKGVDSTNAPPSPTRLRRWNFCLMTTLTLMVTLRPSRRLPWPSWRFCVPVFCDFVSNYYCIINGAIVMSLILIIASYTNDVPRKLSVDPLYIGLFIRLNGKDVTLAGISIPK